MLTQNVDTIDDKIYCENKPGPGVKLHWNMLYISTSI